MMYLYVFSINPYESHAALLLTNQHKPIFRAGVPFRPIPPSHGKYSGVTLPDCRLKLGTEKEKKSPAPSNPSSSKKWKQMEEWV